MLCFSKPIESAFGFSWRPLVRGVSWEIDGVVDIDVAAEDGVVEAMLPGSVTRWGGKLCTSAGTVLRSSGFSLTLRSGSMARSGR